MQAQRLNERCWVAVTAKAAKIGDQIIQPSCTAIVHSTATAIMLTTSDGTGPKFFIDVLRVEGELRNERRQRPLLGGRMSPAKRLATSLLG